MRVPFVHWGSNVGWMANGTPRSCAAANTTSWAGWPSGIAVCVNGATNAPRAPAATARSSSTAAAAGSPSDRWAAAMSRPSPSEHQSVTQRL